MSGKRNAAKKAAAELHDLSGLITMSDAAALRGVSRAAIATLVKRGRLNSKKLFNNVLVYRDEVLAFEKQKPGPRPLKRKAAKGGKK